MLKGHRKTLKECFIQDISADEASIIRTLTFGVGSGDDIESFRRLNELTNLLQEDSLSLRELIEGKESCWKFLGQSRQAIEPHRAQDFDDWTIVPNGFTIDETESTNEIIFICFNSNVYTDKFPTQLSTRLFNCESLSVTRETRDERRIE